MKYFSMFSGIGGFEIGITNAFHDLHKTKEHEHEKTDSSSKRKRRLVSKSTNGLVCIGYSEIDPYADAIYKYNFGGTNYGDATKINPTELPDFDLLVGGFPCQAFSIAGKRRGFEDTRGTLIFDVFRILKEKQPRHVILENVKGLLSHDSGRTFKTIITSLAELGYAVEWQVLNAKNFGVPQNRERVFIIGHLGGFGGRQVFPIRRDNKEDTKVYQGEAEVAQTVTCHYGKNQSDAQYVGTKPKIRRLTPTECERLMGLPDGWTKFGLYEKAVAVDEDGVEHILKPGGVVMKHPETRFTLKKEWEVKEMSDTRRYKACGNGVVTNVVEEVVRRLYGTQNT